jgi:hypothetical protein
MATLKSVQQGAIDLTRFFQRAPGKRAGEIHRLQEFLPHLTLSGTTDLSSHRTVAIVDDVYTNGTTTGAILHRLSELQLPKDAQVFVVAPLWLGGPPNEPLPEEE